MKPILWEEAQKCFSFAQRQRDKMNETVNEQQRMDGIKPHILGSGANLLPVLVPFQLHCRVGKVNYKADFSTFVRLVRRIQLFGKSLG